MDAAVQPRLIGEKGMNDLEFWKEPDCDSCMNSQGTVFSLERSRKVDYEKYILSPKYLFIHMNGQNLPILSTTNATFAIIEFRAVDKTVEAVVSGLLVSFIHRYRDLQDIRALFLLMCLVSWVSIMMTASMAPAHPTPVRHFTTNNTELAQRRRGTICLRFVLLLMKDIYRRT